MDTHICDDCSAVPSSSACGMGRRSPMLVGTSTTLTVIPVRVAGDLVDLPSYLILINHINIENITVSMHFS